MAATITGYVQDSLASKTLAIVRLKPLAPVKFNAANVTHGVFVETESDETTGAFTLTPVEPGQYTVAIIPADEQAQFTCVIEVPDTASSYALGDLVLSGTPAANTAPIYVRGPASAVDNDLAQFSGTTGKLIKALPITSLIGYGTTAARPAPASSNAGWLYGNTTTGTIQRSSGSAWVNIGGSGSGTSVAFTEGSGFPSTAGVTVGDFYRDTDTLAKFWWSGSEWI